MEQPKITGSAPQLLVPDVAATAQYYVDKLGFSLIGLVADPPVYGMVVRDGYQVHFAKAEKALPNAEIRPDAFDFILWIPEIDAFYDEMKRRGAKIIREIELKPYCSREFVIEDNNGYRILIGD